MRVIYYFRGNEMSDTDADGWVSRDTVDNNDIVYFASEEAAVASMAEGDVYAPDDVHHETWSAKAAQAAISAQADLARVSKDPAVLRAAARSSRGEVRAAVAGNRSTPMDVLWVLRDEWEDEESMVCYEVARIASITISRVQGGNLTSAANKGWGGAF